MADSDSVIVERQRIPPVAAPADGRPTAAFTVDVEDWYQSCVDLEAPISERVVRNVNRIVEVLDDAKVKGTFFVQGRVAETFPRMLQELVAAGHEIQSHGYSHRSLFSLDREDLRDELERSVKSVEDACGQRVTAFRAPDFSILADNLWALESLAEAGFVVDSSIFPQARSRYGIRDWISRRSGWRSRAAPACSKFPSPSGGAVTCGSRSREADISASYRAVSSRVRSARSSTRDGPSSCTATRPNSLPRSSANTETAFLLGSGCIRGWGEARLRSGCAGSSTSCLRALRRDPRGLGAHVKIVFLAANDPIYLPSFFKRVLSERARSVAAVFAVPPLYKGQSSAQAAWRYFRTFGAGATVGLVRKLAGARRHGQSIEAVCARYGVPTASVRTSTHPSFSTSCAVSGATSSSR